jgi:acyl carrier protein
MMPRRGGPLEAESAFRAAMTQTSPDAEKTIIDEIQVLLERRGAAGIEIKPASKLAEDLGMDSLELAELSAALEDELGSDPYTEGFLPETVAELVGFYKS